MSSYTEHVTRVLAEDREHPGLGTVAVLTFAPPEGEERRPATLGPRSIEAVTGAIGEALDRAEAGEIQAIALTGTGKVFLAGADLSMFADPTAVQNVEGMTRVAHDLQIRVRTSPVPVLAHLNGVALGGGLEVALMADVRTAAPGVRGIGLPETSLGILPGWGGTTLLQSVVGAEEAVRMILEDPARDKQLSAAQAMENGLFDELAEDLDAALDEFAALVAAHADLDEADADVVDPALAETASQAPADAPGAWAGREAPLPAEGSAEAEALDNLPDSDVKKALASIGEDFRLAVYLADVEGYAYKEIAEIMNTPIGTVMSRLHRGRRQLRDLLTDYALERGFIKEAAVKS